MTKNPTGLLAPPCRAVLAAILLLGLTRAAVSAAGPVSGDVPGSAAEEQKSLELMLASQRIDKRAMLKEALALTPSQSDRFWPLY